MEGIQTPDGKPVDVDPAKADQIEQNFARAMSEPVGDDKQPPRRPARAPGGAQDPARVKRGRKPADAPTARSEAPTPLSRSARVEGCKGVVQVTGAVLMFASTRVKNPIPLAADSLVIVGNADQLSEAVADTAEADPRFAVIVDKICAAGPYGALISVAFGIGAQCARNHGLPVPGTAAPEDLIRAAQDAANVAPMAA